MKIWRSIWLILLLIILFLGVPFLLVNWNDIQPMISSLTKGQVESVQKAAEEKKKEAVEAKPDSVDKAAKPKEASKEEAKVEAAKPVFQGAEIKTGSNGKVLGIAPKGWSVKLKSGDKTVGSAVASKDNGQWLIVIDQKNLKQGKQAFVLEALSPDAKTALLSSQSLDVTVFRGSASPANIVLLEKGQKPVVMQEGQEKIAPVAASTSSKVEPVSKKETVKSEKKAETKKVEETLKVGSLDYKSSGKGTIGLVAKGAGTPGETVQFFVNRKSIGTIKVDKSGKWMFEKTVALEGGNHQFKVTQGAEVLMRTLTYRPVVETSSIAKVSEEVEKRRKAVRAANLAKEAEKAKADKQASAEKAKAPEKAQKAEKSKTPTQSEDKPVKVKTLPVSYMVIRGDSLWGISDRHYGDGAQYWKIYRKNRTKIRTPDLIYPGQKFIIP